MGHIYVCIPDTNLFTLVEQDKLVVQVCDDCGECGAC